MWRLSTRLLRGAAIYLSDLFIKHLFCVFIYFLFDKCRSKNENIENIAPLIHKSMHCKCLKKEIDKKKTNVIRKTEGEKKLKTSHNNLLFVICNS